MNLEYILVNKDYEYYSHVKYLFEHAFPVEERPPFSRLIQMDKNQLFAVEDDGVFVGLFSIVEYKDLLYIFFLAFKKKFRGQGYGSKVLQDILTKYSDKRVYLLAEDPDVPNNNQAERDSRIKFYEKNGLKKTNVKVVEYEIPYVVLISGEKVSKQDFLDTMKYLLGFYFDIYKHNVL